MMGENRSLLRKSIIYYQRSTIWKTGCGGRIRTGDARRMRPLPYHLATPRLIEDWHGVPVLPRTSVVLETSPRRLAPAVSCMFGK